MLRYRASLLHSVARHVVATSSLRRWVLLIEPANEGRTNQVFGLADSGEHEFVWVAAGREQTRLFGRSAFTVLHAKRETIRRGTLSGLLSSCGYTAARSGLAPAISRRLEREPGWPVAMWDGVRTEIAHLRWPDAWESQESPAERALRTVFDRLRSACLELLGSEVFGMFTLGSLTPEPATQLPNPQSVNETESSAAKRRWAEICKRSLSIGVWDLLDSEVPPAMAVFARHVMWNGEVIQGACECWISWIRDPVPSFDLRTLDVPVDAKCVRLQNESGWQVMREWLAHHRVKIHET